MLKQLRNRWLDWGAEFSFSAIFLGLLAFGLGFSAFDTSDPDFDIYSWLIDVALIGGMAIVILLLVVCLIDIRARLRTLTHEHARTVAESRRDVLTGLLNREKFVSKAKTALAKHSKKRFFALFLIDVDHFKQVNDTHGHPAGRQGSGVRCRATARAFSGRRHRASGR